MLQVNSFYFLLLLLKHSIGSQFILHMVHRTLVRELLQLVALRGGLVHRRGAVEETLPLHAHDDESIFGVAEFVTSGSWGRRRGSLLGSFGHALVQGLLEHRLPVVDAVQASFKEILQGRDIDVSIGHSFGSIEDALGEAAADHWRSIGTMGSRRIRGRISLGSVFLRALVDNRFVDHFGDFAALVGILHVRGWSTARHRGTRVGSGHKGTEDDGGEEQAGHSEVISRLNLDAECGEELATGFYIQTRITSQFPEEFFPARDN